MKIMAVDDERMALYLLTKAIYELDQEAEIIQFNDSEEAFSYLEENKVDIAFFDIEMDGYSGIELAEKCTSLCQTVNIIFVTGYSQYAMDAFKLHASGYLMKPVRVEELRIEMENLRYPVSQKPPNRVRIHTFGNFEIFVDDKLLPFPMAKCREALAYLVDRKGARVVTDELAGILWEDKIYDKVVQNNTHRVISDLLKTLRSANVSDIIIKTRKEIAVDIHKIDCDYYEVLKGDMSWLNGFYGEYMSNYSWAEFTTGELCRKAEEKK